MHRQLHVYMVDFTLLHFIYYFLHQPANHHNNEIALMLQMYPWCYQPSHVKLHYRLLMLQIWLVLSTITFGATDNASHDKLHYELLMLLFMPR